MTPAILLVLSLLAESRFDRAADWLEALAFLGFMTDIYILII
nr:MAG TPA: hypothetical protein [Caudoviricetes sp.]